MRLRALATALVLCLLVPPNAAADHLDLVDADDALGRLDVSVVETWPGARPMWKVVTYERWRSMDVWDRGFVLIYFDTFGDDRYDYRAVLRSTGRRMDGLLFRDRDRKSDYVTAFLRPWRSDRSSVSVRIPLEAMRIGPNRVFYMWAVQTLMSNNQSCRRVCFDRAPDQGAVIEPTQTTLATAPLP